MNIKKAQEQIKNTVIIYLEKDDCGHYEIPVMQQRPIFLMGPPGIGKTAIMEQTAIELDIALVSYTMTHHTRQSALGLPFIVKKEYGGEQVSVSEYTMSEIIASVYDVMEKTGKKEGILFLDEINCVSETLAPAMLQFLQYKTFGQHRLPEGWVVAAAGNPPEYNNSVKQFDIATWDRLKRVDVEPSYDVWKEYAYKAGVHPAILTYLDIKKEYFYSIETTVDGKIFVTARGWEDLSRAILMYEKKGLAADDCLMGQYIQSPRIAKDFSSYYMLFKKYKSDYQVDQILYGRPSETIRQRAMSADFDERISLTGLIIHALTSQIRSVLQEQEALLALGADLKKMKTSSEGGESCLRQIKNLIKARKESEAVRKKAGTASLEKRRVSDIYSRYLTEAEKTILSSGADDPGAEFDAVRSFFAGSAEKFQEEIRRTSSALSNAFYFFEDVFEEGQEMTLLVTELTENYYTAKYISQYGCREYFKYNKELLFGERAKSLMNRLEDLGLDQL